MKGKHTLLALLLVLGIITSSMDTPVQASNEKFKIPLAVSDMLNYEELKESCIISSEELHSHSKDSPFIIFELEKTGYIIYDKDKDLVVEYSILSASPYSSVKSGMDKYYLGPVQYYSVSDNEVYDLSDRSKVTNKDISTNDFLKYCDSVIENQKEVFDSADTVDSLTYFTKSSYGSFSLTNTLATFNSSYYCGLDGIAILLDYYDDHYHSSSHSDYDNYIVSIYDSSPALQSHLYQHNYIPNCGTNSTDIVNGTGSSKGLNDYLNDVGVAKNALNNVYNFSIVQGKISNNAPVMIGTDAQNHPDFGDHWVIVHGTQTYSTSSSLIKQLKINDGFGSNNITISANDSYYDWMVYLD